MSLELSLVSFLRDDSIRGIFSKHLTPDLVVEDVSRLSLEAILAADSSDLGVILSELRKRLDNREIINDILNTFEKSVVPFSFSTNKRVIKELESYIRWRKTSTQVNYMACQNLDSIIPANAKEKEAYLKLEEAINFSVDVDDVKNTFNFTLDEDYDRAKLLQCPEGKSMKSRLNVVYNALRSSGYVSGELTMFVAPPGVGKSTALSGEGVSFTGQGFNVLHYILGDLSALDVCHKYIANATKRSLNSVFRDSDKLMKVPAIREMFDKVIFKVKGTYEMDVDELCNDIKRMKDKFNFDALIIDYDGNIRPSDNDNSYADGGYTYGKIRQLGTDLECTTLIGCQPKIGSWKESILGLDSANDSSKKQHHVDTIITASKPDIGIPLGTINLAKARSGETGRKNAICYFTSCATLLEISREEYHMIEKWYTKEDEPEEMLRHWAINTKGMQLPV